MKMSIRNLIAGIGGAICLAISGNLFAGTLNGAGATFPAPLYQQWISEYSKVSGGVKINYQAVGSGAGLAQIRAKTVDFGASDEPLKKEDLDKDGMIQFPLAMGAIVPVVNLPDIKPGELKFSGPVLVKIFMGKITSWADPEITRINEGLKLPDTKITMVHRADGSGTTWNFTNYLSKVSEEWSGKYGCAKEIAWFEGSVGGRGNSGVAAMVKKIKGSVGYVESAYAFESKMTYTQMLNKSGKFVKPCDESFQAAAENADWKNAPGFYMVLTDQAGEKSWPIMASTYILIYKNQPDKEKIGSLTKFFTWSYDSGTGIAKKLNYVPMPKNVSDLVKETWKNEIK
ncbi:MAG TPA: phosphate ABC transporter substrate-binding protein PstS [Lentisphaeria bacterium]|nr:MAG: phosphate ABC transporter substrate-binding protein PstS [Lentisphaerae bacterium GWF2_49_21]HBC87991.1 phosphate ABC transporter substrate-binding protein PstS [Lentisphaeria bacterium]